MTTFSPKKCNCCDRVVHTLDEWNKLPYIGTRDFIDEILEYRQCSCNNTLVFRTFKGRSPDMCSDCMGDGFNMGRNGPYICNPCKGTGKI